SLAVGQKIELNDQRIATIRFLGPTHFQTGDWVGVELKDASGKNDGSVKGERYFICEPDYGMFLRPAGIRQVLEDEGPRAKAVASNGVARGRPSNVHTAVNGLRRQAATDAPGRGASVVARSPTPGARLGSGLRSPIKQPGSNGVSSASTSRTNTPPAKSRPAAGAAAKPRQSLAPPTAGASGRRTSVLPTAGSSSTQRSSRSSLAPPTSISRTSSSSSVARSRPSASRAPSSRPQLEPRLSSTAEGVVDDVVDDDASDRPATPQVHDAQPSAQEPDQEREPEEEPEKPSFAPPPIPPDPPPVSTRSRRPSSPTAASIHSQRTIRSTTASNRQIEELEAKVRLLERKRQEDREVKKTLEQAQQERDQYKSIIEKLQNKYRPQQQEIADLRQTLAEAEKRAAGVESMQSEHDSVMELATLDREMAEEKAESLQAELEALRARNEEMELELEILKEENGELSKEMSPEERTSAGWLQMEKSNERLREALLRLRDITQDKEAELRERIDDLEVQVKEADSLQTQYNETKEKLLRTEADTSDLRQQLEVALESEEMIEELTERNGRLDAQIAQLRLTIEELEDLRELNDELQVNYTESEKQLQEEIDFKESLLHDRERTAKQQQEALDEADYTITRYRALVGQMQSDLADLQASRQISESEAADLSSKSRAMLDLNLRLRDAAEKTQVKTIDLELRKLDAQEASEHLAIVQMFLPDAFQAERDSVLALLRLKRIAFKAALVAGVVREGLGAPGRRRDDAVFAAVQVLDHLTWVKAMADRFTQSICGGSVEDFAKWESALYELEPVERALNGYLDAVRRDGSDGLREAEMVEELKRSMAVMEHLASLHVKDDLAAHAEGLVMRTLCLQSQLEGTATALGIVKAMVESNVGAKDEVNGVGEHQEDVDEDTASTDLALILNRADTLIQAARNAKVMAGKTHRSLADLQARSLTLDWSCAEHIDRVEPAAAQIAAYTRQAGEALQHLFSSSDEGRNDPFTTYEVTTILSQTAVPVFALSDPEAGPFNTLATRLRSLQTTLSDLASVAADLDNTVEFDRAPAPWVARATQLKQTKLTALDTEAELTRSHEDLRQRDAVLKEKETELEEQGVRIEMLEARMKEAGKRSARIGELERALWDAKEQIKRAKLDLGKAREEAEKEIEKVRTDMGKLGNEGKVGGGKDDGVNADAMGAAARLNLRRQKVKIGCLEGAVCYLHDENFRLRMPAPDSPVAVRKTLGWLHEPLLQPKPEAQRRREGLKREGKDLLHQMLQLVTQTEGGGLVDLTKIPENKLAWRPARERPRWAVERRKEVW
ncbi:hypothetical protein BAUCODRAFT_59330, partial [Baudoinia panamericana UAMH 10762]